MRGKINKQNRSDDLDLETLTAIEKWLNRYNRKCPVCKANFWNIENNSVWCNVISHNPHYVLELNVINNNIDNEIILINGNEIEFCYFNKNIWGIHLNWVEGNKFKTESLDPKTFNINNYNKDEWLKTIETIKFYR